MARNCGYFNPWTIRRVTLSDFTWLDYIIDSPDRNIEVWHDSITLLILQILPGINIGVQYIKYTSEYIPKLQIHQHSLLTRKVFSWHNLSSQVFFSVSFGSSSSHIHLQVIFIVKSSSVSSHLHQVWIITWYGASLDHHQVWIITWSRASLDHHQVWIITGSRASLDHRQV